MVSSDVHQAMAPLACEIGHDPPLARSDRAPVPLDTAMRQVPPLPSTTPNGRDASTAETAWNPARRRICRPGVASNHRVSSVVAGHRWSATQPSSAASWHSRPPSPHAPGLKSIQPRASGPPSVRTSVRMMARATGSGASGISSVTVAGRQAHHATDVGPSAGASLVPRRWSGPSVARSATKQLAPGSSASRTRLPVSSFDATAANPRLAHGAWARSSASRNASVRA